MTRQAIPTLTELLASAFAPGRAKRSTAYVLGASDSLQFKLSGKRIACPFQEGSAEFDAFFAGVIEGRAIYAAAFKKAK